MTDRYQLFNFIKSPAAVYSQDGELLYTNSSYDNSFRYAELKRPGKGEGCTEGVVFATEKGIVKCYLVSADEDDLGNKICLYKEITPFVSRKSMTEIVAADHKNSEYALRKIVEKNTRMSSLIDSLESGILLEGSSGNLIQVNNSFLKMISSSFFAELPQNEYDADYFHGLIASLSDSDGYISEMERIKNDHSGGIYTDEIRFTDGRVYRRTFRQLYVGDEAKGFLWKFKDITIRKELESFNVELEANIRALESSETVGIYMEYSGYRFVNRGLEQILESDRDSIAAAGLGSFIPGELFAEYSGGVVDRTVMLRRRDGSELYVNLIADSLTIAGKQAHVITLKDTTENINLNRILEKSENRFRNIFENNLAVMLIFDAKTLRILDANRSAEAYYGKSAGMLAGMEMCDLSIVDDMEACMFKLGEMVTKQTGSRIPAHQRVADGSIREVELLMTPLGGGDEELLFVIVDDIHDRMKYERELISLNENLIEMVEKEAVKRRRQEELLMEKSRLAEMGEMIGNIAHQWRQPLNALAIIIQDLSDACHYGELTESYIHDVIEKGMDQIDYMSKTIDDFRDFFRPSTQQTVFDVKKSVSQVLSIFLPQVKNCGIDVYASCRCGSEEVVHKNTDKFDFCNTHDVKIKGYANQFKQVLLNLLSNSRYAVLGREKKRIDIRLESIGEKIRVTVEDTGGGIPTEILDRVFDPYFTTKIDDGGTGIGLYMSKAIVEDNLGGSLTAENINGGCRVSIEVDRIRD